MDITLTPDQIAEYARRIYAAVRREVAAYGAIDDAAMDRDFAAINRRNVELYFRVMSEERKPDVDELADFQSAAQRRLHQAVPLEAIFHSYHVGVRVLWECLLDHADGRDLGRLAALTLEYADCVTNAAATAYLEERERLSRSRQEATRLFFTRLFSNDFDDELAVQHEAQSLGYDLCGTHIVAVVAGAPVQSTARSHADLVLAQVREQVERVASGGPTILMRTGLVVAVPGDAVQDVIATIRASVAGQRDIHRHLVVGIGTPRAGVRGLVAGLMEAQRAQALGSILHPGDLIHRYDELRLFDLFKEGDAVDAFVQEVLGNLIERDRARNAHLAQTLDELFASALNRKLAARRLGVHPNTLSYRIHRIETLLDGSLLSGEFCFRVQLALKLLPLSRFGRAL